MNGNDGLNPRLPGQSSATVHIISFPFYCTNWCSFGQISAQWYTSSTQQEHVTVSGSFEAGWLIIPLRYTSL